MRIFNVVRLVIGSIVYICWIGVMLWLAGVTISAGAYPFLIVPFFGLLGVLPRGGGGSLDNDSPDFRRNFIDQIELDLDMDEEDGIL